MDKEKEELQMAENNENDDNEEKENLATENDKNKGKEPLQVNEINRNDNKKEKEPLSDEKDNNKEKEPLQFDENDNNKENESLKVDENDKNDDNKEKESLQVDESDEKEESPEAVEYVKNYENRERLQTARRYKNGNQKEESLQAVKNDKSDINEEERMVEDEKNDRNLYKAVKDIQQLSPAGRAEFEKAKSFLSTISSKSKISLYDHLSAILQKVLRHEIADAMDKLEEISFLVRSEKQTEEGDVMEVAPLDDILMQFIEEKKRFYKFPAGEDVQNKSKGSTAQSDSKAEGSSILPDFQYNMHRFALAGVGLSPDEVCELSLALESLVATHRLKGLRFWGKVFASANDYYIAESLYQDDVSPEEFGWIPDQSGEGSEIDDNASTKSDGDTASESGTVNQEQSENSNQGIVENEKKDTDEEKDSAASRKSDNPPTPGKAIPEEKDGCDVNERLYFACTQIGQRWRCLPLLNPYHITEAKNIKRFFSGNLEAEVGGYLPFRGREAHYLRAQIARISASTHIAPTDYYKEPGEDESKQLTKNDSYDTKSTMEVFSSGLDAWVHSRQAILDQGHCKGMKLEPEDADTENDEDQRKEEDEEGFDDEAQNKIKVPLLRSLSEDEDINGLKLWNFKLSSKLSKNNLILMVQSNLWPGAYTFYDEKSFDHIYIGFGYKYSTNLYAPLLSQKEDGSDALEIENSEMEESEGGYDCKGKYQNGSKKKAEDNSKENHDNKKEGGNDSKEKDDNKEEDVDNKEGYDSKEENNDSKEKKITVN